MSRRKTEAGMPDPSLRSRMTVVSMTSEGGAGAIQARYEMTITGWHPARLNSLMGRHPMQIHKAKAADKSVVAAFAALAGLPTAKVKRRLSLVITLGPRQRRGDDENWTKSLNDALVSAGLLVDDSPTWLEMGTITFERGRQPATRIILEESTVEGGSS